MTTTAATLAGTSREAGLALALTLEWSDPSLPSVDDVASTLTFLNAAFPRSVVAAPAQGRASGGLRVRRLSFDSPFEIVLHIPSALYAVAPLAALASALIVIKRVAGAADAARRVAGFPIEVKTYLDDLRTEQLQAEIRRLHAESRAEAARVEAARSRLAPGWTIVEVAVSAVDDGEDRGAASTLDVPDEDRDPVPDNFRGVDIMRAVRSFDNDPIEHLEPDEDPDSPEKPE